MNCAFRDVFMLRVSDSTSAASMPSPISASRWTVASGTLLRRASPPLATILQSAFARAFRQPR
ncbi:hypothetical protein WS70_25405 [Burkholderia mayonis]|uniref:Uncharacterized protein n=1 Tax=Burkholderia mayonis TaxID=1385591 RepID=A0A1B4FN11_9BURK|nr:hypothetical protein WS70_25405 [Burkholderia mayonis]KVE48805.1 hypothetical protein WS70_21285 [Burkholderia mayonis]